MNPEKLACWIERVYRYNLINFLHTFAISYLYKDKSLVRNEKNENSN